MYKGGPRDALGSIGARKEGNSALGVFRSCGCHGEALGATGCRASGCLLGETAGATGPWLLVFRLGADVVVGDSDRLCGFSSAYHSGVKHKKGPNTRTPSETVPF